MTTRVRAWRAPRIDFNVTQDVIDRATKRDSSHCMIAEALIEAYPQATYVSVDLATIRWTDEAAGLRYIYLTTPTAQRALLGFDQGIAVEPFHIRADCAQVVLTSGARKRRAVENRRAGRKSDPVKLMGRRGGDGGQLTESLSNAAVPTKVGGQAPGSGPLRADAKPVRKVYPKGKRREFGLRRFTR
jgi:hypothetical protein